ncbi:hypothetical protein CPC08DRAFT_771554, partial [Agrocybe pediades]
MGKSKKNPSQFTASSSRHCDVCKLEVKIGFGGEGNWAIHLQSKAHKNNLTKNAPPVDSASATSSKKVLTSYFTKKPAERTSAIIPSTVSSPPNRQTPSPLSLLKQVISTLPDTVQTATPNDYLARYASNPRDELDDDSDVWEMADHALNVSFGFGKTAEEISSYVRRGQYGMDAVFQWMERLVKELGVSEALLEGKVERIIEALLLCGATKNIARSVTTPVAPTEVIDVDDEEFVPQTSSATQSSVKAKPRAGQGKPCPGYQLLFPAGQSVYSSYCFYVHVLQDLPWSLNIDENKQLVLHSNECAGCAKVSKKGKETAPLPCTACANLENNAVLMGMRHRAMGGLDPSTPWAYLSYQDLLSILRGKTDTINRLKLQGLNSARKLMVRNRHLAAWKRLAMAIGREDIPRIRTLMATQLRSGASVFSIIEKVDQAARRVYSPRGYDIADFQRAFLIYKLGGRAAAEIAHRALGIPSIDATKRHINTVPLQSSPGFPMFAEMQTNLHACYGTPSGGSGSVVQGVTIAVDELKVQERLRWDPRSNYILGVCREHGDKLGVSALQFKSIVQADDVLSGLKDGTLHFATE